jgi:hypothetical protein
VKYVSLRLHSPMCSFVTLLLLLLFHQYVNELFVSTILLSMAERLSSLNPLGVLTTL